MSKLFCKFFPQLYTKIYFFYKTKSDNKKIKLIKNNIKEGDTIIDIGANIGFYTVLFSKLLRNSTIYGFEPDKENFSLLKKNVNKYSPKNNKNIIKILNIAVGEKTRKIKLYKSPILNVDHQTYNSGENRQFELVKCVKLDNFFSKGTKIDFIKIDTQGYDYYAIEGCKRIIEDNPNIKILGELWPYGLSKSGSNVDEYLQFFKILGFTVKIEDRKFDLNNKHCYEKKYYTDFFAFQK